jgi:hypothetical protein
VIFVETRHLPRFEQHSLPIIIWSWMIFIRLFHTVSLSSSHLTSLSVLDFSKRFLWIFFPLYRNPHPHRPITSILTQDTLPNLAIAILKVFLTEWICDWLELCLPDGKITASHFLAHIFYSYFYALLFTLYDYPFNILQALTPLLTLDCFRSLSFNNWFLFSNSPRTFWGYEYNLISQCYKRMKLYKLKFKRN